MAAASRRRGIRVPAAFGSGGTVSRKCPSTVRTAAADSALHRPGVLPNSTRSGVAARGRNSHVQGRSGRENPKLTSTRTSLSLSHHDWCSTAEGTRQAETTPRFPGAGYPVADAAPIGVLSRADVRRPGLLIETPAGRRLYSEGHPHRLQRGRDMPLGGGHSCSHLLRSKRARLIEDE